jgi:hypothetical protein
MSLPFLLTALGEDGFSQTAVTNTKNPEWAVRYVLQLTNSDQGLIYT